MRRCECLNVSIHVEAVRKYDKAAHYSQFGRAMGAVAKVDAAREVDFHVASLGVGGIKAVSSETKREREVQRCRDAELKSWSLGGDGKSLFFFLFPRRTLNFAPPPCLSLSCTLNFCSALF
jgi:hypothetical protein